MYYDYTTRAYKESPNSGELQATLEKIERLEATLLEHQNAYEVFLNNSHWAVIGALERKHWRLVSTNTESGVITFLKGNLHGLLAYMPSAIGDSLSTYLTFRITTVPKVAQV